MTPTYCLRKNVFICRSGRHWVVLDANHDRYSCIDAEELEQLRPWLLNPSEEPSRSIDSLSDLSSTIRQFASELVKGEILTENPRDGLPFAPMPMKAAVASLQSNPGSAPLRASLVYAPSFFRAARKADKYLAGYSINATLQLVRSLKAQSKWRINCDVARLSRVIAQFETLRWFYPREYLCLFDSLALLGFLALNNLSVDLVFGVTAEPFQAHCWLQHDSTVLNDTLARVSGFSPILSV